MSGFILYFCIMLIVFGSALLVMVIFDLAFEEFRQIMIIQGIYDWLEELERPLTITEHIGFSTLLVFGLINISIGFIIVASVVDDDYWRSVFIEAGNGTALFLGFYYYNRKFIFGSTNIFWFIISGAVLLISAHSFKTGYWQSILIEIGSGLILFAALEYYFDRNLKVAKKFDKAAQDRWVSIMDQKIDQAQEAYRVDDPLNY